MPTRHRPLDFRRRRRRGAVPRPSRCSLRGNRRGDPIQPPNDTLMRVERRCGDFGGESSARYRSPSGCRRAAGIGSPPRSLIARRTQCKEIHGCTSCPGDGTARIGRHWHARCPGLAASRTRRVLRARGRRIVTRSTPAATVTTMGLRQRNAESGGCASVGPHIGRAVSSAGPACQPQRGRVASTIGMSACEDVAPGDPLSSSRRATPEVPCQCLVHPAMPRWP